MKLDLGCGRVKKQGYLGVDVLKFDGVDVVLDIGKEPWPWEDNSVEDVYCSHVVEHLEAQERIHFVNELYRVLKSGKKAWIQTPHWASARAFGDLTHKWPPVSEFWPWYLNKRWREQYAPHDDFYTCDFEFSTQNLVDPKFKHRDNAHLFVNGIGDLVIQLRKR